MRGWRLRGLRRISGLGRRVDGATANQTGDVLGAAVLARDIHGDVTVHTPAEPAAVPPVEWAAEHISTNTWLLRNVGAGVATNATVDTPALGGVRVDITPDMPRDIRPGESVRITATGAWGKPVADEVRVSWGSDEHAIVPRPRQ